MKVHAWKSALRALLIFGLAGVWIAACDAADDPSALGSMDSSVGSSGATGTAGGGSGGFAGAAGTAGGGAPEAGASADAGSPGTGGGIGVGGGSGAGTGGAGLDAGSGTGGTGGATGGGSSGDSGAADGGPDGGRDAGGDGGGNARSMGFIGCSMGENVANGYQAVGGMRMWPAYGTGGLVVQSWTDTRSPSWRSFDQQAAKYGKPNAVWVQICIFEWDGATYDEVKQLIANAREHAAPDATIYITGQPFYESGADCLLAGPNGPKLTDDLAQQAAADPVQNVIYSGKFGPLGAAAKADFCHANAEGERLLGEQALKFFGR